MSRFKFYDDIWMLSGKLRTHHHVNKIGLNFDVDITVALTGYLQQIMTQVLPKSR